MVNYKDLKQRITIEQILRHYKLRMTRNKKGDEYATACPFCSAGRIGAFSTGALKANYEKNCFKCFSCDAQGNIFDFLKRIENFATIREAAEFAHAKFLQPKRELAKTVFTKLRSLLAR